MRRFDVFVGADDVVVFFCWPYANYFFPKHVKPLLSRQFLQGHFLELSQ